MLSKKYPPYKRIRFAGSKATMERENVLERATYHELSGLEWYTAEIPVFLDELSSTARWIVNHISKADEQIDGSIIRISYDNITEPDIVEFPYLDIYTTPAEYLNQIADDLHSSGAYYLRHIESGDRYYLPGTKQPSRLSRQLYLENSSKKDVILRWKKAHPYGTQIQCARDIGANPSTVNKWWHCT